MQPLRRKLKCRAPFDAHLTFGPVSRGPAARVTRDDWWRAMNSPEGRVTVHVHVDRARAALDVAAWGPGRDWALERAPELTGLADDPRHFAPAHPILTDLHHRLGGLRLVRLGAALDVTAATILEQRVTSVEAARAWRGLVFRHGAPAPGNAALRVPPSAEVLRQLPDWEWRRLGVEQRRSAT
ncbi:MAG TPA: DNA-3-methyladenine glycosylase 2 family protein, partial [Acidimicrobiia bacterium]|nr:DNA-3-methyladenine glycosylase 2 family protein [Acidimicrobiia bacterium]